MSRLAVFDAGNEEHGGNGDDTDDVRQVAGDDQAETARAGEQTQRHGKLTVQVSDKAAADADEARINALIEERREAKKAKNFARADEIRKSLLDEGIVLMDGPQGTTWRRI